MQKNYHTAILVVLYTVLVCIAVIALFPMLYILMASFRTDKEIFAYNLPFGFHTIFPKVWTLASYHDIFAEYGFGIPLRNSFLVVLVCLPVNLLVASVAGYAFAFFNFKGKQLLFALFIVSFMVPADSVALPLYTLVNRMGLVNTFTGLILPGVSSGLAMFLFTQFFRGIPRSFIEAGTVDGANWGQIFTKIIMPLSVPVFITAGLMVFVNSWNDYLWPLLCGRNEEVRTIQVALGYFKDENETYWSYIYAASSISALVPILMFLPFQKYFVEGVTSSGIKG